jgi:hypothetical protein
MNKILAPFLIVLSFSAQALELKFVGPCSQTPIKKVQVSNDFANVGELTVATLTKFKIHFVGGPEGIASMFSTPVGDEAVEVISDFEMRAYGWCFSIDGVAPEVYPNEVPVTAATKSITWHFGFARYYKGQWVTQCTPAYSVKPDFLCKTDR